MIQKIMMMKKNVFFFYLHEISDILDDKMSDFYVNGRFYSEREYLIQWMPYWVKESYLKFCDDLIKEYFERKRKRKRKN